MTKFYHYRFFFSLSFFCFSQIVHSSGFAVKEQSAVLQGSSYAGATTSEFDSSSIFFNPALASYVKESANIDFGYIHPTTNARQINSSNTFATSSLTNNVEKDFFDRTIIPALSAIKKINEDYSLGLTINSAFGFSNEYDKNWSGRYHAIASQLKTVSINPIISHKPIKNLSLAGGPTINYADATLSQAIDNRSLYVLTASKVASLGGVPLSQSVVSDGYAKIKGSDWGYGWTAGVLYKMPHTQIGLSYRSEIKHKLDGRSYYSNIDPFSAIVNQLQNSFVTSKFSLPASLNFGMSQKMNDKFKLMADVSWTEWSSFKEIRIVSQNGAKDSVTTQNWKNTMFYALGGEYNFSDELTFRTGVAYDQTPTSNTYRTPRIPDANRYWGSLGVSYEYNQHLSFNIGYSHIEMQETNINLLATPLNENNIKGNLNAQYKNNIDILMISTGYKI